MGKCVGREEDGGEGQRRQGARRKAEIVEGGVAGDDGKCEAQGGDKAVASPGGSCDLSCIIALLER